MKLKYKLSREYRFVERPNGVRYYDLNVDFYGWGLGEDDHKLLPLESFLEIIHDGDGESELVCLDTVPRNGINEIIYSKDIINMTENFIIVKVIVF